jgi:hypothetical protein
MNTLRSLLANHEILAEDLPGEAIMNAVVITARIDGLGLCEVIEYRGAGTYDVRRLADDKYFRVSGHALARKVENPLSLNRYQGTDFHGESA